MTQREFVLEVRRGLLTIMRAMVRYYGLAWIDFLPRDEQPAPLQPEMPLG